MTLGLRKTWAAIPAGLLLSSDLRLPLQETSPEQPLCAVPSVGCKEAEMNTTTPTSGAPNLQNIGASEQCCAKGGSEDCENVEWWSLRVK